MARQPRPFVPGPGGTIRPVNGDPAAVADPAPPAAPEPSRGRLLHPIVLAMAVSAGLVVIASTLPWAESADGAFRASGAEGDGRITIPLAVVGGALCLFGRARLWTLVVNALFGAVTFAIAAADLADPARLLDAQGEVNAAGGLWMTVIGAAAWTLASLVAIVRRRSVRSPDPG
jgi:hypothetical protein